MYYINFAILGAGEILSEHWNIYFYRKKTQNPIEDYLNSLSLEELAQAEKEIKLLARHGPFYWAGLRPGIWKISCGS